MESCNNFRDQWLERALDATSLQAVEGQDEHLAACSLCTEWLRSRKSQVRALLALERAVIPEDMLGAIEEHLAQPALERALRSLPVLEAPEELAVRVNDELVERAAKKASRAADPERARKSLSVLDYESAPPVLERLINEELAAPKAHVVERFVGNLEPRLAPPRLGTLVARELRGPLLARVVGPAAVAAAVLVAWFAYARTGEPARRLRVVTTEDISALDPMARSIAEVLRGGAFAEERR